MTPAPPMKKEAILRDASEVLNTPKRAISIKQESDLVDELKEISDALRYAARDMEVLMWEAMKRHFYESLPKSQLQFDTMREDHPDYEYSLRLGVALIIVFGIGFVFGVSFGGLVRLFV